MAHMRARKNASYSQNILSLERQWAQIFAPHNDGILPEHLQFLVVDKAWTWTFPFLQQKKIPHCSVSRRKEHIQQNHSDNPSSWSFISLSLRCFHSFTHVFKSSFSPADQMGVPKPLFFFCSQLSSYNCLQHLSAILVPSFI